MMTTVTIFYGDDDDDDGDGDDGGDNEDLYIIGAVCDVFAYFAFLPFLYTFGSKIRRRKSVQKQEKRQKVSRNGRKCFLPFLDIFGARNKKGVKKQEKQQDVSRNGKKVFSHF